MGHLQATASIRVVDACKCRTARDPGQLGVEDITLRVTFGSDAREKAELTIIRDGKRVSVPVTLVLPAANGFDQPQE
jgi:hypothetical protein